jgi:3-oxoacyl-[acyl-carrier protein] reductase
LRPIDTPELMTQLADQIAVITGAGRGIGRAIALRFAAAGADIVCVSRTAENAEKVAGEVRALGRKAWAHAVDVADGAAVGAVAEKILAETGKVDILVNNAGITRDGLLMRMSEEDWDTVLDTNLKGAFLFIKALSRAFLKQRSGRIINISSVIGLIGNAGQCNYAASKAALLGLTKAAAREFASRGVTVNALAPGFIETDMTASLSAELKAEMLKRIPLNGLGRPEDIAEGALFLAGPGARYVTGQVLAIDGGMVM